MPAKTAVKKRPAKKRAAKRTTATNRRSTTKTRQVGDAQKQAMQQGRQEGLAVRRYIDALKAELAPKRRGRRRTPDQIRERIAAIEAQLGDVDTMKEIELRQERLHLISDLAQTETVPNSAQFEEDFIKTVKSFSERRGVAYDVWREIGVPVIVLKKGGMTR